MSRLAPKDVIGYLSKRAAHLKPASAKVVASSIRSYFRFMRLHGECDETSPLPYRLRPVGGWHLCQRS